MVPFNRSVNTDARGRTPLRGTFSTVAGYVRRWASPVALMHAAPRHFDDQATD
jgi:hypothetical protein